MACAWPLVTPYRPETGFTLRLLMDLVAILKPAAAARPIAERQGGGLPGSQGRKWELETCPFNHEHTGGCAVVTEGGNGAIGFKCHHNGCADNHWRDVRELFAGPRPESKSAAPIADRRAADLSAGNDEAGVAVAI
jgi:hypothetical protein